MSLSPAVQSRLYNWKFTSAQRQLTVDGYDDATDDERDTITTLARVFGDCGYFYGELASVIRGCVAWLLGQPLDAPETWLPDGLRSPRNPVKASKSIHPSTGVYSGGDDGDEP